MTSRRSGEETTPPLLPRTCSALALLSSPLTLPRRLGSCALPAGTASCAVLTIVCSEAMDRTSLTRVYNELTERLSPLPIIGDILNGFNLEEYTVTKALEGLFKIMAEQETKVRTDPASAASSLIEAVFSRQAFRE